VVRGGLINEEEADGRRREQTTCTNLNKAMFEVHACLAVFLAFVGCLCPVFLAVHFLALSFRTAKTANADRPTSASCLLA